MSQFARQCPSGIVARNRRRVQPCVPLPTKTERTAAFGPAGAASAIAPAAGRAATAAAVAAVLRNLRRVTSSFSFILGPLLTRVSLPRKKAEFPGLPGHLGAPTGWIMFDLTFSKVQSDKPQKNS